MGSVCAGLRGLAQNGPKWAVCADIGAFGPAVVIPLNLGLPAASGWLCA